MTVRTYDSKNLLVNIGGIPMEGFGDNKVTITRNNDVTSLMEGVDGDIIFASSNKESGTLSFDLLYGSDYDQFMDNLSATKRLVPVGFTDANGFKLLTTSGMIQSQADIVLGETPDNRTWTMVLASVDLSKLAGTLIGSIKYKNS